MLTSIQSTMDLRAANKKKIFTYLRSNAQSTRKDISRELGLSFGTVATICNELITEGLVLSVSSASSNGGRIPDFVSLRPDSRHIACLDLIQKEQAVLALCNIEGKISLSVSWNTSGFRDFSTLKNSIVGHFKTLLVDANLSRDSILGIGVAIPAIYSHETGLIIHSTNPLLENVALRGELQRDLEMRVEIENESNLLAMASTGFQSDTETAKDVVYLYINEGLGAGITCNGKLLVGSRGLGGEVNHLPIGRRHYRCYCGNDNCVETELSMAGFIRKYREDSGLELGKGEEAWARFEKLVQEGDRTALGVIRENAEVLGALVASLCNLFDPEKVLVGGMLDSIFGAMSEVLELEVKKRLVVPHLMTIPIVPSPVAHGLLLRGCVESVMRQWVPG